MTRQTTTSRNLPFVYLGVPPEVAHHRTLPLFPFLSRLKNFLPPSSKESSVSHARWGARMVDLDFQPKRACLRSKLRVLRMATPPPGPPSGTTSWGPKSYKFLRGSGDTRSADALR